MSKHMYVHAYMCACVREVCVHVCVCVNVCVCTCQSVHAEVKESGVSFLFLLRESQASNSGQQA